MEVIKINGIDEEIFYTISKDGLPIYIWKNPYLKSFNLSLNVKYGSIHTEFEIKNKKYKVPNGIAHFMEHIKFNVKKDQTANDLFDPLGSDINAFTTFQYTSYTVMGTSKITENLNCLLDFVFNPYFTKEMIKKEKGIIASEINMGHDNPYSELYFIFNQNIFHKEKFRNLITGEVSDINNVDLKDIQLIYDAFYHPKNMFLVVSGNVNPYEIEKVVNDNLSNKEIKDYLNPTILSTKEAKSVVKKEVVIQKNIEVEKAKVGFKIPRNNLKKYSLEKLNIILSMIMNCNFGTTSILQEKLLKEELITYLSFSRIVMDEYIVLDVTIESKYIDEAIERIIEQFSNLSVSKEDLKRKINASVANLVIGFEDSETVNNMIQSHLIYYHHILNDLKKEYESISLEEVNDIITHLKTKEICVVKMQKNNS